MKISQEEIDAAIVAYNGSILTVVGRKQINGMTAALTAALTVRRARKQAKRERQRKEKDNTIQKLAADMMTWCGKTLPEMTTDELVSARDELAGFESMSLRENGFYHRMNAEIMARKEKDKQVVESVKPADFVNPYDVLYSPNIGVADDPLKAIMNIAASVGRYGSEEPTPSKASESVKPHLEPYYGDGRNAGPEFVPSPKASASKAPEWAVTKAVEMWKYYKFPSGLGDGDKIQAIARILAEDAIPAKSELS